MLTFGDKVALLKGDGGAVDFSAIGGNGNTIYYGTQTNKDMLYSYTVGSAVVAPIQLPGMILAGTVAVF